MLLLVLNLLAAFKTLGTLMAVGLDDPARHGGAVLGQHDHRRNWCWVSSLPWPVAGSG